MGLLKLVLNMCCNSEETATSPSNTESSNSKYEEVCHEESSNETVQSESVAHDDGSKKTENTANELGTETVAAAPEKEPHELYEAPSDQVDSGIDSDLSNIDTSHESSAEDQADDPDEPDYDIENEKPPPEGKGENWV